LEGLGGDGKPARFHASVRSHPPGGHPSRRLHRSRVQAVSPAFNGRAGRLAWQRRHSHSGAQYHMPHRGSHPGSPRHPSRAYFRGKLAEGRTRVEEAMRCLKRRISDAVYRQLLADEQTKAETGPGGHCGASQESSAVDLSPHIDTSAQPLSGPRNRRYNRPSDPGRPPPRSRSRERVDNRGEPGRFTA
jgi:hypothetical protein